MRYKASKLLKRMLVEIAWLLGSWAISFGLLGWLIGFSQLWVKQLDIQMHNTYFMLPPWALALPLFMVFATLLTGVRAVATRFRQRSSWVVLAVLGVLWALLASWGVWVAAALR